VTLEENHSSPVAPSLGEAKNLKIPIKMVNGKIVKVKSGIYSLLTNNDEVIIENIVVASNNEESNWTTRMLSTSLRHGVPIEFIVEQLQKATEDITSMASAAARVLKKYISNGLPVSGQSCQSCGNGLVYIDGCVTCSTCGWSKCN
jgi:ribonucleoside-diphosphate reductase alpha chain